MLDLYLHFCFTSFQSFLFPLLLLSIFALFQRGDGELASLRESYVSSLNSLEEENRQLRLEMTELRARMEANNQTWQDKYERALLQNQNKNHSHNGHNRYAIL